MKKLFLIVICLMFCQGCILMSDSYYEAQEKEWQARQAAATSYNSKIETKLVEVNPETGNVIVYNQNQAEPMKIPEKQNAFVRGADVVLNSAVGKLLGGGWAAGYFASKLQSDITNSGDGDMNVTQRSNNAFENNHAEDGTVSQDDSVDNSDNRSNYENETSDPTIVTQPKPTIVRTNQNMEE